MPLASEMDRQTVYDVAVTVTVTATNALATDVASSEHAEVMADAEKPASADGVAALARFTGSSVMIARFALVRFTEGVVVAPAAARTVAVTVEIAVS